MESYWSIVLASVPDFRVVPNPQHRYNLNSYSDLELNDHGSLDLSFGSQPVTGQVGHHKTTQTVTDVLMQNYHRCPAR